MLRWSYWHSVRERNEWGLKCGALPANTEEDLHYIQMQHSTRGAGTTYRLRSTRMHAFRSLLLYSDREPFAAGRHFQKPSLHMRFIFAAGGLRPRCRLMLRLNPPKKNKDERRRKDIWRKLCNFVLLSIFNGKGEVFIYFGFFSQIFLKVLKL